jgi:hypothetical protein
LGPAIAAVTARQIGLDLPFSRFASTTRASLSTASIVDWAVRLSLVALASVVTARLGNRSYLFGGGLGYF